MGAGLLFATFARTQQQAFMGGFFFMIPAILLSGNLTPILAMAQSAAVVHRDTAGEPAPRKRLAELWTHALWLLAIGTTLFVTAVRRFRMHLG